MRVQNVLEYLRIEKKQKKTSVRFQSETTTLFYYYYYYCYAMVESHKYVAGKENKFEGNKQYFRLQLAWVINKLGKCKKNKKKSLIDIVIIII